MENFLKEFCCKDEQRNGMCRGEVRSSVWGVCFRMGAVSYSVFSLYANGNNPVERRNSI